MYGIPMTSGANGKDLKHSFTLTDGIFKLYSSHERPPDLTVRPETLLYGKQRNRK